MRPTQQTTAEVMAERAAFAEALVSIDASRLIFAPGESGVIQGLRLAYGYAPSGERCVEAAPYRKGRRTSLIGWIGSTCGAVTALPGTVGRAEFERFVVDDLAPSLEAGDVVVWDNHTIHKDALLVAEIEAKGASVRWLPRYSPDMNPAEWLWSWLKRRVRVACADTSDAVIGALREAVSEGDVGMVEGWIRQGGFQLQPQTV